MWWKAYILSSLLVSGGLKSLPEATAEREVRFDDASLPSRLSDPIIDPRDHAKYNDDHYPSHDQREEDWHEHDPDDITLGDFDADQQFEERSRNDRVDTEDTDSYDPAPHPFLLDDEGNPVERSSRILSKESAKIGTFNRLGCNPVSWSDCTTLVSNNLPSGNDPLTIPCGQCYTFDMNGNVTLNGIDIKGKLVFPVNHKAIVHTPFVIVQGEMEITVDHPKVTPDNIATRFVLTGTNDVLFSPTDDPNQNSCSQTNNQCNLGAKPFVIVGGKVNINAMPESCSTHTPVKKKVYTDPVYNPDDFPKMVTLPPSCPQSGQSFVSYDFNSSYGNWTGRDGTFMELSDGAVKVSNRRLDNRGPYLDVTPIRPELCLVPNQEYLFVARLKLDMADGTLVGKDSTCKSTGRHCPELRMVYYDKAARREYTKTKTELYRHRHVAPKYGEYFDLTGTVTFIENELSPSNAYYTMLINGPEEDIDITIDSFDLFLPSEASYQEANDSLCEELIFNGDAEGNGFNPYPMYNPRSTQRLTIIEEDGNKFWRLFDRDYYKSSINYRLNKVCLTRGLTYTLSSKVRFHHSDGFVGGSEKYNWFIAFKRISDGRYIERDIVNCDAQSIKDGWVTCSGDFIVDEEISETLEAVLTMRIGNSRDGSKYDLDFDDISIRYNKGYVSEFVVDNGDVSCWGNDADVHVTTAAYYSWSSEKPNGFVSQISGVVDNGDGTSNLALSEAVTLPVISEEENSDYAVEIALLSRNVIIEGEKGEDRKGGYMQVLHTPNIAQRIQGVEYLNMGRRSETDRFALQLLYSDSVAGTLVSRNSFRQSNHRCIAVEGTSNLTISHNIGYQTSGHCVYIGYQSRFNVIKQNLVSGTKRVDRIADETDDYPTAFFNWYNPNDFIGNIAVASERYGFVFSNPHRTRLEDRTWINESVRKMKIGVFDSNVAKSNGNYGFLFYYHESGEEALLTKIKSIKNRYKGFYLYASYNVTFRDSLFADNSGVNIDARWADNVNIQDTTIRGYTSETKALVAAPYLNKPCISSHFDPPVGIKVPTQIHRWDRTNNIGMTLTNVLFTEFDHSDECETSVPVSFNSNDNSYNHFNYPTMLQNVTFDGTKIMDATSSVLDGLKDIVIHDIDGSSDPLGQASKGMFVSNVNSLTDFSVGNCTKYHQGISYCAQSCYRTVTFMVDQLVSDDSSLRITRETDGKDAIVPFIYKYDDNTHLKHYSDNFRFFSVSLPTGSYRLEFLDKSQQPLWPGFVLPRWEGIPQCKGYVSEANITVVEPPSVLCDELVVNGDMELGISHWNHRSSNGNTKYGGLIAVEGQGMNNSTALRHYNRRDGYAGIGQHLDTRCLQQSLNEFYEIQFYFRLEDQDSPFICNPFSSSWEDRCPSVTFKQQWNVNEKTKTRYSGDRANIIIPNYINDFSLVHGVFKVDQTVQAYERIYMYMERAHRKFDMIVDNVSVTKLSGICGGDLVRNGNFDDNGKFWRRYGNAHLDIETLPNKNLKVFNKPRSDDGAYQDLYIDRSCFQKNQRFKITGKFRIESASNGTKYQCDSRARDGELECSYLLIRSESKLGTQQTLLADTVAIAQGLYDGWSTMGGILTVTEKQAAHDRIYVRLYGPHTNMNVFYDDISITPIPKSCESLVLNSDFEVGDSRFWRSSDRRYIDTDISTSGTNGSKYSLMIQKYSSHRIFQDLDSRCVVEGQEFLISAKFKLLNATDLTSGVECEPSILNVGDRRHCPTITIRGENCAVRNVDYVFFNKIDHYQWNPNEFNNYEKVLPIEADLASCQNVKIEIGRWVHKGRVLLVDDIQVTQRTTLSPTPQPTFAPTVSKNTPTKPPTIMTESPSTTNFFTCPSVGDVPLTLSSGGSVMLSVAGATLCTLTKSVTSGGKVTLIPIARTYNENPWEQSAGEYAASIFDDNDIICYEIGCQINLPSLEASEHYLLSSSSHSLSERDEYARFLETSTFGITQEQLDTFGDSSSNVGDDIVNWVSDQMNSTQIPMTSHREYWRRGINARLPASTSMGTADHPCDLFSRWRKISFIRNDLVWSQDKKLRVTGTGPFKLELNRWIRTVVSNLTVDHRDYSNYTFDPDYEYTLCRTPEEKIDGRLYIELEDGKCVATQNPAINLNGYESSVTNFFNLPDDSLHPIDQWWNGGEEIVFKLQTSLFNDQSFATICSKLPSVPEFGDAPIFGKLSNGTWLMFDPRLDLETNTLGSPKNDGGKEAFMASGGDSYCSNVPRTFLNEDQCQLSSDACKLSSNTQIEIKLDNSTIAAINNLTGRYVYAIKGLLVKYSGIVLDHPCTPGLRSRWEPKDIQDCTPTPLYENTAATLSELLSGSGDRNLYLRDIHFPEEGKECDVGDTEPEIEILVGEQCWKRVHDDHMSLFDMTYWVENHPGGPTKIQKWSKNNGTTLIYPSLLERNPHGMSRWNNNWHKFTFIGRFGDRLKLGDLPNDLRRVEVTNYFGNTAEGDNSNMLVCGSPGEVSNNKGEGILFDASTGFSTTGWDTGRNRKYVWIMIALSAPDQLRQRVAWALSQILVVVKSAIGSERGRSEWFLYYYDIFVRNAFGNYRDVLKEVSYNPLMAENLSFLGSKSSAYMLQRYHVKTSADENFAREIMQLFTMGLMQLNMDGSAKLDSYGNTMLAYTNDDIMSLSRAWTGFDLQLRRGNMEGWDNRLDPMRIIPDWRDRFPKSDTTNGYIGDSYPLCSDFPSKSFLRQGATYRFLGSSSLPELMEDPTDFATKDTITRVLLNETSSLRTLLCNEDHTGNCVFQNSVTLSNNYNCTGVECEVDTLRVVQVNANTYYEYVPAPCVNFIFYDDPVKISPRYSTDEVMCADAQIPVASEACCSIGNNYAIRNSLYSGERVTLATAESRCTDVSRQTCDFYRVDGDYNLNTGYFWTADSCVLRVKVKRDGTVAIVHQPSNFNERVLHVNQDNNNYFRVYWGRGGDYPNVDNDCDNVCQVLSEGSCLCNTAVLESKVFDSRPSSKAEVMEKLSIGAVDPRIFDSDTYSLIVDPDTNITIHLKGDKFTSETIFEFDDDKGRTFFMKNSRSSVYLRGLTSGFTGQSFRNAPQFMSFIPSETTLRDAQYETEATLDHYLYHENTPPFIASRLIQRLVTSNPSPRYIEAVANAFKTGSYTSSGGVSFGAGNYGDLASTFAAIYLDNAARNVLLDADITTGSLREPILKVLAVMRSMKFTSSSPVTRMDGLVADIGQMAHEFGSVFSFFLPEFKPYGRIGDASLVSPEATLLNMPKMIGLMNGLASLVKYGLSNCEGGWGYNSCRERTYAASPLGVLEFNRTIAETEFSFETFEGPSLSGGLDNVWVGRDLRSHNGKATLDPFSNDNHVIHFPRYSSNGEFFSEPIQNLDQDGNPYVVKFKYLGSESDAGGCIGYVDASSRTITQTWAFCDYGNVMKSNGEWVSCQFVVPSLITSFRIVVGDRKNPGGNAYFDDIQLASGNGTTCTDVEVPRNDPLGQVGYSNTVVDRLSTLLTAGRLGNETKAIVANAFDSAGSAEDGLRIAQQLILTTGEFHTTDVVKSTDQPREVNSFPNPTGRPYKAVIYLMLSGGCDSFNMLTPYTCSNGLYESYLDVRQQVALAKNRLLPISALDQVCTEFGLHPELSAVKDLYNDKDLLFFANTGVLSQPVNKDNYNVLTNTQLFAHNHMQREAKRVDPYDLSSGTGVLGRMTDILTRDGSNVGSFSVDRFSVALAGKPGISDAPMIVDRGGVPRVYLDDTQADLAKLHNTSHQDSGIFADTWSSSLMKSIGSNERLSSELANVTTQVQFPNTNLGNTLKTISRLIATRHVRGVDVDTFYIEKGGFDTHSDVEGRLNNLFSDVDSAFDAFSREMKAMDLWNNVTLIQTSDFARTLNPNGGDGTDHAWGGNYMMMGGSVKGGEVLGKYPEDITDDGPMTLGRGRMIPTTPWDAPFRGIARWLGIGESNMDEVCPNLHNFNNSSYLIDAEVMFSLPSTE